MPPGEALLALFVTACVRSAEGTRVGLESFESLSKYPFLSAKSCDEIWQSLVGGCCSHGELAGLRV